MKRTIVIALVLAPLALAGCSLNSILGTLANQIPEAVIDALPQEGHAPLTVQFDARFSRDDGALTEYYWDFGDQHDTMPLSCSSTAMHTYKHPGTYIVKLTVIDNTGEVDSEKLAIVVQNPPPVASFTVSNDMPPVGVPVSFDASDSYDPNGEIASYAWDFGDGNTGSGIETSHVYDQDLYYVVTLTVTDNDGETGIERKAVIPQTPTSNDPGGCQGGSCGGDGIDNPLAVITGLPSCAGWELGVPLTLDGSASRAAAGTIIQYKWNFGDGETATGETVTHTYQKTGRFTVSLTVNDSGGLQATAYGFVDIHTKNY